MTADAKSRAYGDANPALTYQVGGSGLVNGDTLSGALATSATTASNVGTYGIAQGTLAASGNYALNYASANLTVTPARDHGDGRCEEPRLWRCQSGADLSGRRLGPRQRRQRCRARWRHRRRQPAMSAPTASRKGARGLEQLRAELCGRRPDRHPARDHRDGRCQEPGLWRCQSGADLSGRRLGPGQWRHLSGALATSATTASNVGIYGIAQGTLAASSNYALNYASANLTVTQRAITVTADAQEPRLWRRQSGADLSGRRLGPRQRRHACRARWQHRRRRRATSAPTASRKASGGLGAITR